MEIQIVVTLFVLFAASRIILQYKNENVSKRALIFWLIIWGIVTGVAFWPNLVDRLARYFGVSRGIDVVVYFGLVALFYMIYRAYIKIEHLERDITKIVRSIALKDLDKKE
ncbi:MAG: hypothetical protein ACD_28C00147G0002 [uncultured bacterium]|nr:MAG: hypothetical protein ACD_28C00147G0002 [uncultured bacterium]KKT75193.1 MAG: hypothetical protein UW70_C0037G0007 [Candidatus Peregrinibacteria bacterium GW2011_GWA2_44_7]